MGLFSRYAKAALFLGAYQVPLGLLIITYEFVRACPLVARCSLQQFLRNQFSCDV
jgi:hypothetical protein